VCEQQGTNGTSTKHQTWASFHRKLAIHHTNPPLTLARVKKNKQQTIHVLTQQPREYARSNQENMDSKHIISDTARRKTCACVEGWIPASMLVASLFFVS